MMTSGSQERVYDAEAIGRRPECALALHVHPTIPLGGEDFSYYGREVPAFQFRLGVARPDREMSLHRADFDPDERAIGLGIRLAAELVWDQLQRGSARR